jgi:hypothetical protein
MLLSSALLAVLLAAMTPGAGPACHLRPGSRVVLYSAGTTPDVFVWDSRFRMNDYAAGTFDQRTALLPHALLAPPGTRGVVESCVVRFVQWKYDPRPDDAVGLRIVTGPLAGKRGWVTGSDARLDLTRMTQRLHRY